jgi:hypothetical protein
MSCTPWLEGFLSYYLQGVGEVITGIKDIIASQGAGEVVTVIESFRYV